MEIQAVLYCAILFILFSGEPSGSRTVKQFLQVPRWHPDDEYLVYTYQRPLTLKEKEERQDFSKIPGVPGVDYPIYHSVPHTNFDCRQVPAVPGMYANIETGCQAYHVCHDGREGPQGASFLCTNGTIFNQKEFACDWWYNVNCNEAPYFYSLNLDSNKNPYTPKAKQEEQHYQISNPDIYHK